MRRARTVAWLMLLAACLTGCGFDGGQLEDVPSRAELLAGTTPEPEPTEEPTPVSRIPDEWYDDANGDRIPDVVAEHLGWDPEASYCIAEVDCIGEGEVDGEIPLRAFNTLLLLDASGSMMEDVADGQKMEQAQKALEYYVTGIPETTDVGMLAYGHEGSMDPEDYDESCEGVELLGELGEVDHESLPGILEPLSPTGFTPLAAAIAEAHEALSGHDDAYNRIVVVSDGRETCDGDPVEAAEAIHEAGLGVVDVLAFDVPEDELPQLANIAEAGGGELVIAADGAQLREALRSDLTAVHHIGHAQACAVTESVAMKACLAAQQTHVTIAFDELLDAGDPDGEPWDEDQKEEIRRLRDESELWNLEQLRLVEGDSMPSIRRLNEALLDAHERMQEVYDEDMDDVVSFAEPGLSATTVAREVTCPAVGTDA